MLSTIRRSPLILSKAINGNENIIRKILPSSLSMDFTKKISDKDRNKVQRMLGDYIKSFIPGN